MHPGVHVATVSRQRKLQAGTKICKANRHSDCTSDDGTGLESDWVVGDHHRQYAHLSNVDVLSAMHGITREHWLEVVFGFLGGGRDR